MWKALQLYEVAVVISGQSPKGENYNKEGKGLPFYQGKKDYGKRFLSPPTVWTTEVTKKAQAGDILMSVRAPVGALNYSSEEICIGRGLAAIRAKNNIVPDYLYYSLLNIRDSLTGSVGAIFNSINKKQIEEIQLDVSPLAEQQRIVSKLDAAFAGIDVAVAAVKRKQERVDSLKNALLSSELGAAANDAATWSALQLYEVAIVIAGQSPRGENYNKEGKGLPFYQGKKNYGKRFLTPPTVWTTEVTKKAQAGDILMSVRAPVGALNYSSEEICIGRGLAAIRAKNNIVPDYLYYSLLSIRDSLTGNVGAIFNSINKKQIEEIQLAVPPLAEQQRIVTKLDAAFKQADIVADVVSRQLSHYQALKSALLTAELTREAA